MTSKSWAISPPSCAISARLKSTKARAFNIKVKLFVRKLVKLPALKAKAKANLQPTLQAKRTGHHDYKTKQKRNEIEATPAHSPQCQRLVRSPETVRLSLEQAYLCAARR